jgi:hypothetical protein
MTTTDTRATVGTLADQLRDLLALTPDEPPPVIGWRVLNLQGVPLTNAEHEAAAVAFAHFITGLIDGSKLLIETPDGEIVTYPPPATVTPFLPADRDDWTPEAA